MYLCGVGEKNWGRRVIWESKYIHCSESDGFGSSKDHVKTEELKAEELGVH